MTTSICPVQKRLEIRLKPKWNLTRFFEERIRESETTFVTPYENLENTNKKKGRTSWFLERRY